MFASLMLALMLGQCSSGQCSIPSGYGGYAMPTPSYILMPPAAPAKVAVPKLVNVEIVHEGMAFTVQGTQQKPGGIVNWNPESPFNAAALAVARERKRVATLAPKPAPKVAEKPTVAKLADPFPGGVIPNKVRRSPGYHAESLNALAYVAALAKPEPSNGKMHLTVIGTADERAQVVNDVKTNTAFDTIRDNLLVQDYDTKDWPVDPELGFQPGRPAILLQAGKGPNDPKGGRVIYRAADYSQGPEGLAEAVRKADPNYKPADDPGPANEGKKKSKPDDAPSCPFGFTKEHTPWAVGAAFVVFILCLVKRKEG